MRQACFQHDRDRCTVDLDILVWHSTRVASVLWVKRWVRVGSETTEGMGRRSICISHSYTETLKNISAEVRLEAEAIWTSGLPPGACVGSTVGILLQDNGLEIWVPLTSCKINPTVNHMLNFSLRIISKNWH